jgi:threonine synthase
MSDKFHLKCQSCGTVIDNFESWFENKQKCPQCKGKQAYVLYNKGYDGLKNLIGKSHDPHSMWHYLPYLPVNDRRSIISFNEGIVNIDRWKFLEKYAKEYFNVDCMVYAHRCDQNPATGTFKDMAGTVVASVLKENNKTAYVVASTGNIGNAYAKYLCAAGINLYGFIPSNSSAEQEAGIAAFGQKVNRVSGDYARAKKMAAEFAQEHDLILAAGNFDPMRIEAKKTMVYEWLRVLPEFPTVYMQALSGGTGPLGIKKAFGELTGVFNLGKLPKQIMVQSGKCDPMTQAWNQAKANNFPNGWETNYPVIENPDTYVPTLATGNPQTYPVIAPFVRETAGEIISSQEDHLPLIAAWIAMETSILIGPAATVTISGFMNSLRDKLINTGDVIVLNIGEGINRSPRFLTDLSSDASMVQSISECDLFDINQGRKTIIQDIHKIMTN